MIDGWRLKAENIQRAWAHFDAAETQLTSTPFRASIELTQNCNFRCVMCVQSYEPRFAKYRADYNMKMELFEKIAEQLFPSAVNVDLRGFGETTTLPYWPEIIAYIQKFPLIEWNLVSNLSLTRADTWDLMMKSNFVVGGSVDGSSADTFEAIRVGGNFARTRDHLGVIRDAIKRHDSGYLYFNSTIQRSNAHQMRSIIELAHEFDVVEVQFHVVRGYEEPLTLNDKLAAPAIEAVDAALDLGVTVTFDVPAFTRRVDPDKLRRVTTLPQRRLSETTFLGAPGSAAMMGYEARLKDAYRVSEHHRCFKPFAYANVNHSGEMGPCNHLQHPDMVVVDNLEHVPLAEIWNGEAYQDFRRQLLSATPRETRCQWCFANRLTD